MVVVQPQGKVESPFMRVPDDLHWYVETLVSSLASRRTCSPFIAIHELADLDATDDPCHDVHHVGRGELRPDERANVEIGPAHQP
jgi:hypothetical protein